ncbi:MAG TPA: protein kinase [Anaerolineae bacterium]|nr:protein kinase [Anaerolineae bacterium]
MTEIRTFLERHLQSIFDSDLETYHTTTMSDLTLYEWYVTPHRIDGLPFHDFMMSEAGREDTSSMALDPSPDQGRPEDKARMRFDLANYHEQRYGDTAICSYTLLISKGARDGVTVMSYNESRVLVLMDGEWKVVHVHKSPSWNAPFQPPPT